MNDALKKNIEDDLYDHLRWLLCAATEWAAYKKLVERDKTKPDDEFPMHLQVYTMNTVFLHARSLYEFFTATEKAIEVNEQKRRNRLTWRDYGEEARQTSKTYCELMDSLHGRVMHVAKDRAAHKEIKNAVVHLAADILSLWKCFATKPGVEMYAAVLDHARQNAIGEAAKVAEQYKKHGFEACFS